VSDQIRQRRNEALQIVRERDELDKRIRELEDEFNKVSALLTRIEEGRIPEQSELRAFELVEEMPPLLLKLRLRGLHTEKKGKLEDLRREHWRMGETLTNLSTCPSCGGQGTLSHRHYERSDGMISTIDNPETCLLCAGTGIISLGDDVQQATRT
jgi:hypothetical protein